VEADQSHHEYDGNDHDDDYYEEEDGGIDDGRPAVMMQPDMEAEQYMDDEEFL
jgi:hypothetical protein